MRSSSAHERAFQTLRDGHVRCGEVLLVPNSCVNVNSSKLVNHKFLHECVDDILCTNTPILEYCVSSLFPSVLTEETLNSKILQDRRVNCLSDTAEVESRSSHAWGDACSDGQSL